MTQRGVSIDALEATLKQTPFRHFHQGVWKTGYYDPATRIFAGEIEWKITTVIGNATPKYLQNLIGAAP